jgi:hypothetical protein
MLRWSWAVQPLRFRFDYCHGAHGVLAFKQSGRGASEASAQPALQAVRDATPYKPNEQDESDNAPLTRCVEKGR